MIVYDPEKIWILQNNGCRIFIQGIEYAFPIALPQNKGNLFKFDRQIGRIGSNHRPVYRINTTVHHNSVAVGCIESHIARLTQSRSAVVK